MKILYILQSTMFHYNIFIVLAIVASILTNPIVNTSVRCCFPDLYSLKIIFDSCNSIVHMMLNADFWQTEES